MTAESWLTVGVVHVVLLVLHDLIAFVLRKSGGRAKRVLRTLWLAYRTDRRPVRIPIRTEVPGRLYDLSVVFVLCGLGIANLFV